MRPNNIFISPQHTNEHNYSVYIFFLKFEKSGMNWEAEFLTHTAACQKQDLRSPHLEPSKMMPMCFLQSMGLNTNSVIALLLNNITLQEKGRISIKAIVLSFPLLDETVGTENLNGHATATETAEEVKVDIESPETVPEEQATGPASTEDKTGIRNVSCHNLAFDLRAESLLSF